MPESDGFQKFTTKKSKVARKRIFIGNLPSLEDCPALEEKLLNHIRNKTGVSASPCQLVVDSGHAFFTSNDHDSAISSLHQSSFEGKKLIAQRERKNKKPESAKASARPFSRSWAAPSGPKDAITVGEDVAGIVSNETHEAIVKGEDGVGTMLAATAVVGVVADVRDLGDSIDEGENPQIDFENKQKSSLAALMSEYGEFDPDWKKVVPVEKPVELQKSKIPPGKPQLAPHGKAPVHVEFTSFGYAHGVPSGSRTAMNPSYPFAPFDCRSLGQVDPSQTRLSGLSPGVKRFLISMESPNALDYAVKIAEEALAALLTAISDGYGYANNLRISVFVGSEFGRHRSVVIVELAATHLRTMLRENKSNRVRQPCSVGTFHRDIEKISHGHKPTTGHLKNTDDDDEDAW